MKNIKPILLSILNRLNNKGTILALAGLIGTLLIQMGVDIKYDKFINIVQTVCNIFITLGILNNPTNNTSAYVPGISDSLVNKE